MPSLLKANDSGKMYDVPEKERDEALASGKFTEHFRIKTKDSGKEYIIPAADLPEALDSGKFELAEFYDQKKNIEANPTMPKMNPAASFALKAGNAMTMGFGDNIIEGFGGDGEGIRKQMKASDIQNPTASMLGSLVGGMASPSLVGAAGKTFATAIGKGALSGALSGGVQAAGENENRKNLGSDVARGVMFGGVIGAGAGAIGKKVGDAVSDYRARRSPMPQDPIPNMPDQSIKTIGEPVPTMTATDALPDGALSGVKEAAANVPTGKSDSEILAEILSKGKDAAKDLPYAIKSGYEGFKKPTGIDGAIVGNAARIPQASSEFFKYFKSADINRQDMADIAGKLRKELPDAASLSDEQLFLQAMSEPGQNSAKVFAANRVKATGGDDKAFLNLLNKAPEETAAGRGFNKIDTAHELAGDLSKTYDSFRAVERKAFEELKNKARASFPKQDLTPVKDMTNLITSTLEDSDLGSARPTLSEAFYDLAGRSSDTQFSAIQPADQFDRLLQARQRIDKKINWQNSDVPPAGQEKLKEARSILDTYLKSLDDMAKADKGYSRFKRIEDELFAKIGTKKSGQIVAFEPTKVEDLLGGTKTSRRLGAALEGFKRQLASGEISSEARGRIEPFIKKLDEAMSKAKTQRDLTAFRYEAGPTSPAVQQLSQKLKPQGIVDLAGQSPQLFLKLRETIPDNAKAMFGANYSGLSPSQKEAVAKFSVWRLSNLTASEREANQVMQTFMKVKK